MNEKKSNPAPIGKPKSEAPEPSLSEMINEGESELGAMINEAELHDVAPDKDRIEALAKRLCAASGYRPDAYFMGRERWTQFTEDAMRFLVALDFVREEFEVAMTDVG